jgi:Trimethylamine:corrinoid methyltransferase
LLKETDKSKLKLKVVNLLQDMGVKIENDKIVECMKKKGCTESANGRIRIPETMINEFVQFQETTRIEDTKDQELYNWCSIDWTHHIMWDGKRDEMLKKVKNTFTMSAFDCGPTKYYDYFKNNTVAVNTEILTDMMKLAEATPEIGYISTWYRQDVDPRVERVDSLVKALKITKKVDGIEAIYPEVIKYLKEASEIITGRAGDSSYLAGSECMTSPLILERRSAEDILERARLGIHRYHVASMITIGVNTPITIASSAILGAAEILSGMIACWCVDPESDITGRMISSIVDMRNANSIYAAPEVTMVNIAVKEVFDTFFGGHLWTEVFFSPSAKVPGLQTVFEYYSGVSRYSYLTNSLSPTYPGMGTLDNGAVGSPTQLMLDMEIRKSDFKARKMVECTDEMLMFDDLCDSIINGGEFFTSEYTLAHFRELWSSSIFRSDQISSLWAGDEKCLLDKCDQLWRDNVKRYTPPEWPEEKMKALDELVLKINKDLLK